MSETVQDSFTERIQELRKLLSTRGSVRRGLISKRHANMIFVHWEMSVMIGAFCLVRLLSNLVYILNSKAAEIQMALVWTISNWNVEIFVEFHFWCKIAFVIYFSKFSDANTLQGRVVTHSWYGGILVITRWFWSKYFLYTGHGYYLDGWLLTGKPSRYITNHPGQLSLPSLRGRLIDYQPDRLGLGGAR